MHDRFRNYVYGVALAIMVGWVLHIGAGIFVPVIAAVLVAYIIVTIARHMVLIPVLGRYVPVWLRYTVAILIVLAALAAIVWLLITNVGRVLTLLPHYQFKLLAAIQGVAIWAGIETEPTWETIRRDVFGSISLQSVISSTAINVSSILGSVFVVIVYTGFLLAERRMFARKLNRLSAHPDRTAFIRLLVASINDRIGEYLAMKTFVNAVLGLISWAVLVMVGLDLAPFWALMIGVLNYIPFIGSVLGVLFPTLLAVIQFDSAFTIGFTFLGLTAAQIFVGSVLEPSVMGRQLNLSPFAILLSVTVWAAIWGIAGALLAVPITAIMVIVFSEFEGLRPIAVFLSRSGSIPRMALPRRRAARSSEASRANESEFDVR